jgi:hypothetical protein
MITTIKPTVGRVVFYRDRHDQYQPNTAIITYVYSDYSVEAGKIDIASFDHLGEPYKRIAVTLVQDGELPPVDGKYAYWMPYQLGQAKTESDYERNLKRIAELEARIAKIHAQYKFACHTEHIGAQSAQVTREETPFNASVVDYAARVDEYKCQATVERSQIVADRNEAIREYTLSRLIENYESYAQLRENDDMRSWRSDQLHDDLYAALLLLGAAP